MLYTEHLPKSQKIVNIIYSNSLPLPFKGERNGFRQGQFQSDDSLVFTRHAKRKHPGYLHYLVDTSFEIFRERLDVNLIIPSQCR